VKTSVYSWLAATLLSACPLVYAETVNFAVFGDTPYRHWERENLPQMMAEMDAAKLSFAVNIGDIKGSSTPCADAVFIDILNLFQNAAHPLIYTPGDNEWTDCERGGGNYRPQERLSRLRELFHGDDYSLGKRKIRLERQSKNPRHAAFRENARWQLGGLLFLTINVPGSHNNIADPKKPSAEYLARNAAILDWLTTGFRQAKEKQLPGIVIFMHADPSLGKAVNGGAGTGYADLLKRLVAETRDFRGQVMLVHGDTHYQRVDKPLGDPLTGATLENFTRVEVYGSPFMGWMEINADTGRPGLFRYKAHPFSITTQDN
jgi:hypothetical protein